MWTNSSWRHSQPRSQVSFPLVPVKWREPWDWGWTPLFAYWVITRAIIGHFRVPKKLTFKARLSAKLLIRKWFLIMMQIKLIFTTKVSHLASFWKWDFLELGNGLLWLLVISIPVNPSKTLQYPCVGNRELKELVTLSINYAFYGSPA